MKIIFVHLCAQYLEGQTYRENLLPKYFYLKGNEVTIIANRTRLNPMNFKLDLIQSKRLSYDNNVLIKRIDFFFGKLPLFLNIRLNLYKNFLNIIDEIKPDLIYINSLQFGNLFSLVKYAKNNNIIVISELNATAENSARNPLTKHLLHQIYYSLIIKNSYKYIDKIYSASEAAFKFSVKNYYKKLSFSLLPLGVDESSIRTIIKNQSRREVLNPDDDIYIVTGGKIDSQKNILELISAFNSINIKKLKLIIFGTVKSSLSSQFKKLIGDSSRIQYIGWKDEFQLYDLFLRCDVVVFPGSHSVLWELAVSMGKLTYLKSWPGREYLLKFKNVKLLNFKDTDKQQMVIELKSVFNHLDYSEKSEFSFNQKLFDENIRYFSYHRIADSIINDYHSLIDLEAKSFGN